MPAGVPVNASNELIIGSTPVVTFVNRSEKRRPGPPPSPAQLQSSQKIGLVDCIVQEQSREPWNEHAAQDGPPKALRVKTVLTDVSYYPDFDTPSGGPLIEARHSPSIPVTSGVAPESGLAQPEAAASVDPFKDCRRIHSSTLRPGWGKGTLRLRSSKR